MGLDVVDFVAWPLGLRALANLVVDFVAGRDTGDVNTLATVGGPCPGDLVRVVLADLPRALPRTWAMVGGDACRRWVRADRGLRGASVDLLMAALGDLVETPVLPTAEGLADMNLRDVLRKAEKELSVAQDWMDRVWDKARTAVAQYARGAIGDGWVVYWVGDVLWLVRGGRRIECVGTYQVETDGALTWRAFGEDPEPFRAYLRRMVA